MDRAGYYSESLARGLQVIRAFGESEKLRTGEVAQRAGLSRAAARRYLLTLQDLGYVASDGDWFYLRPRVLELGYSYKASSGLSALAEPHVMALAERTREASTFAVLDRDEALVVARATKRSWDLNVRAGNRMPAVSTSLGMVLLAWLPTSESDQVMERCGLKKVERTKLREDFLTTQKNGFSCMVRGPNPQLIAVSVPIANRQNQVVGALNITSGAMLTKAAAVKEFWPLLREAKFQIEASLKMIDVRV